MHWTLHRRTSVALAVVWAGLAFLFAAVAEPPPVAQVGVGSMAGVVTGLLQLRSIREAPTAFRNAATARHVRQALTSTRPGRLALRLQWIAAFAVCGLTFAFLSGRAGRPGNPALSILSGYFALMAARDMVSSRGLALLRAAAPEAPAAPGGT